MLFNDLAFRINSGEHVKIYFVDRENLGLLTGYVYDPRPASNSNPPLISLKPYIGIVNFSADAQLVGYPDMMSYKDIVFNGGYATESFEVHKTQARLFLDEIKRAGGAEPQRLEEYFRMARTLR